MEKLLQQALDNYRKELESLQEVRKEAQEKEDEDNLYDLVMQNVIEAKKQQQQQPKSVEL